MTLTPTRTLLDEARAAGRGIGAFNVVHLETAEALAGAAEDAGLPVILQLSENCVRYHGGLDPIALATLAVAEASSARLAVHLDHAEDPDLAHPPDLPWPTHDWPRAELDPRVDRAALDRLLEHAFAQPEPDDLERTNAVVIVQRGAIVAERYRDGVDVDRAFISWSMAKSITSCLIGILVRDGKLAISQPIPVPEWPEGDPRRRITIDQMLRMTDGLRFREAEHLGDGSVRYYPDDESDVIPMLFGAGKDDVAGFAATLPYQVEPDTRWNYNSGASNLLARLVRDTIGGGEAEMRAFMRRELFDRIGMATADPRFDGAGNFVGSSHCYCSARDFARFGYLYLRNGIWDGEAVLPPGWVDYARTPTAQSDGLYGAHFWVVPGSLGLFYCSGAFGQRILISPKLDLVVVRLGITAPHKVAAVVRYCKELIDAFRPTAA